MAGVINHFQEHFSTQSPKTEYKGKRENRTSPLRESTAKTGQKPIGASTAMLMATYLRERK